MGQSTQSLAEESFRRAIGRCRFQMIDACFDSRLQHLTHLV